MSQSPLEQIATQAAFDRMNLATRRAQADPNVLAVHAMVKARSDVIATQMPELLRQQGVRYR